MANHHPLQPKSKSLFSYHFHLSQRRLNLLPHYLFSYTKERFCWFSLNKTATLAFIVPRIEGDDYLQPCPTHLLKTGATLRDWAVHMGGCVGHSINHLIFFEPSFSLQYSRNWKFVSIAASRLILEQEGSLMETEIIFAYSPEAFAATSTHCQPLSNRPLPKLSDEIFAVVRIFLVILMTYQQNTQNVFYSGSPMSERTLCTLAINKDIFSPCTYFPAFLSPPRQDHHQQLIESLRNKMEEYIASWERGLGSSEKPYQSPCPDIQMNET